MPALASPVLSKTWYSSAARNLAAKKSPSPVMMRTSSSSRRKSALGGGDLATATASEALAMAVSSSTQVATSVGEYLQLGLFARRSSTCSNTELNNCGSSGLQLPKTLGSKVSAFWV